MSRKIITDITLLVCVLSIFSACQDNSTPAPSTPMDSIRAAVDRPGLPDSISLQVIATATISPATYTPLPTFTPLPTVTRLALPSPSAEASAAPEPTEDLTAQYNPLTGEIVADPMNLQRRPIAIKISNAPAKYTRPQSGLGQADLVYEHITEGSLTRFTAVIYGETPPNVGPIRSARLIDLEIPLMYDAALVYSGSSIGVSQRLFSSDFTAPIVRPHEEGYYRTGENKPYEHTLYAHPEGLWAALDRRQQNHAPILSPLMIFSEEMPEGGYPADIAKVRYRKWTYIDWRYDSESDKYYRWVDGVEHIDANSGEQINAANVVLLFVPHRLEESICEQQSGSRCLAFSVEVQLTGLGTAILLRGGQQYEIFWRRYNSREMVNLADANGDLFPMQIGNTWYQIIPLDYPDPVTIE